MPDLTDDQKELQSLEYHIAEAARKMAANPNLEWLNTAATMRDQEERRDALRSQGITLPNDTPKKSYDSNLTESQDTMLDMILSRYVPKITDAERAALREAVDKFTTTATGQAYIFGWNAGQDSQWIATAEKLPEPLQQCALVVPTFDNKGGVMCGYMLLDGDGWKFLGLSETVPLDTVTHWQPIPSPPSPGEAK